MSIMESFYKMYILWIIFCYSTGVRENSSAQLLSKISSLYIWQEQELFPLLQKTERGLER